MLGLPHDHSPSRARQRLLVLSDVHLGSDIAEGSPRPPPRSESVDGDLVALLDHYRTVRDPHPAGDASPWHLVINGDFIDFVGVSLPAVGAALATEASAEERRHGLGTAEDHACLKLARVAERHPAVFLALGRFVAAGHLLTIVPGNHDREFHWTQVKDDLRAHLLRAVASSGHGVDDRAAFLARIQFVPWFLWIEGVAYIEHGHQYDRFCSSPHAMTPLSPQDPRRLAMGFSDVLLRFVVHPIRELRHCNHDRMGIVDYLSFAFRLGLRGAAALVRCYVAAIVELFRVRRASIGAAARALRVEHELRMAELADSLRVGLERVRSLIDLQARPITETIRGILASLLLDRLALGLLSLATLLTLLSFGAHVTWAGAPVLVFWWLGHAHLRSTRQVDPRDELLSRAAPIAHLFPAAFVVMGHTHVPVRAAVAEGAATYINTGSWAEEEGAPLAHRATRTHLVVRVEEEGPSAELLIWDSQEGPKRLE